MWRRSVVFLAFLLMEDGGGAEMRAMEGRHPAPNNELPSAFPV
jgi:hypothetical protein